jgi:hypothetical protein
VNILTRPHPPEGSQLAAELLGAGPAGGKHGEGARKKRKFLPDSVSMLILVVAVAAVALFLMRELGLGSRLQFTNVKIDYPIDADPTAATAEQKAVLSDLSAHGAVAQVPLNQVQQNPFSLEAQETVRRIPFAGAPTDDAGDDARLAAEERQQRIVRTFAALGLNSVVLGSTPVARVSGQTVRVGDTIKDLFVVRAIAARSITLEADGLVYTLSLGE